MTFLVSTFVATYFSLVTWLYSKHKIQLALYVILISALTTVFSTYLSHDSKQYINFIQIHGSATFNELATNLKKIEITFIALSQLLHQTHPLFFFGIYSVSSFYLKVTLFNKASSAPLITLATFLALYSIYFDGTVIRVSLGLAACYWALYALSKDKLLTYCGLISIFALTLHYSLAIFLLLAFTRSQKSIILILAAYILLVLLYIFGVEVGLVSVTELLLSLDSSIPGASKLQFYLKTLNLSDPFSFSQTPLFVLSLIVYFKYKQQLSRFDILIFNSFFLSFVIFAAFYHSEIIQVRLSEMLRFSVIFIAPYFYKLALDTLSSKRTAQATFGAFLALYFYYSNFVQKMISEENLGPLYNLLTY
ncbi:EpsG family protein [Marinomonas sp.]